MNDSTVLTEKLRGFGLNPLEVKIYLYLLYKKEQTISDITKALELPRTSVYDNTLRLIEKGLVQKVIKYKSQSFIASSPDILQTIIDTQREKTENLEKMLEQIKTRIVQPSSFSVNTEVKYYYGQQGIRQMMWNALSAKDNMIGYSSLGRFKIVGDKFIKQWYEEALKRKILDRIILNPQKDTLQYLSQLGNDGYRQNYRQARILPEGQFYISGDTTIFNETFAICYWEQEEIVGVEIQNKELVKSQKSIFEILWKVAKPVS